MLLDKNTVRTRRLRGGGLEIADALGPSGQFVCVKKADSTAPLNHLFAQGRVAIETLRYDSSSGPAGGRQARMNDWTSCSHFFGCHRFT